MCEFGKKNDCMYILANDPQDQNNKDMVEAYMWIRMQGWATGVQVSSINILIVQNRTE